MDRRNFCVSGAAVAVALSAGSAFAASPPGAVGSAAAGQGAVAPAESIPLHKVVYDSRFSASRAFGAEAARAGMATAAIQGDVTALWLHDLRSRWAAGGGAVAGMTTVPATFCLEQLAKDHWLRVVLRAEHGGSGFGVSAHRVRAAAPVLERICSAIDGAEDWAARMSAILASCPASSDVGRCLSQVIGTERGRRFHGAEVQLVSWIIA